MTAWKHRTPFDSVESGVQRKTNNTAITITIGVVFGFLIGNYFPSLDINRVPFSSRISCKDFSGFQAKTDLLCSNRSENHVPTTPRGAEKLPPGIVVSESDFYLRRLWGDPSEDIRIKQKYLVTFTVGYDQKTNIDDAVKKFSENFTIVLFHYDGRASEWDEFEWWERAIHISARKQTKWWYAKRFLHPDIVAPYDYIFIWDEDLGLEQFNADKYVEVLYKHNLDISQPGVLSSEKNIVWKMTRKRDGVEIHKGVEEEELRNCTDPHLPPCAAFVEVMAPVFSRDAWRCVWHMIQNDLVHGWGLDLAFRRCVEPAHEKMGIVDSQPIVHKKIPSLGNQGKAAKGKSARERVRQRCFHEWKMFDDRMENATEAYFKKH